VLDIIHTHPSHQGRGAASQLVKWGTDRADKMRMPCYVESSPAGYPLFRKFDFDDVTDMEIDLIKYRHGYGSYRYKHIVMTRVPDIPPTVPPKNSGSQHGGSGSLDRLSLSNGNSAHRISGKASLIETKRSPRPDRSSSSKESDSATSPKPDQSEASKDAPSVTSTTPNRSNFSRESETVTSMTGRFPEPPSKSEPQDEVPPIDRVWFSQALNKPFIPENEPTVDRVWFSEQH